MLWSGVKSRRHLGHWRELKNRLEYASGMRCFLFVFVLFDLLGVPLKSVILVFLFLFVLSLFLRHVLNMHAPRPHTMDWSVNDSFIRYACFCLFLMFCFARCIRWRFGLLAPNMRATVFERVRSPLAFWRFVFTIYFCLMFTFGSFYVLCVFYSVAHVGLTFLFCTVSFFPFLSFFCWIQICFAYTEFFKNFYIQSHCLPTFFCCFCWSGFFIISFSLSFGFFANLIFIFFIFLG